MNPNYEKQLEAGIDRTLKSLPELQAPETLSARVMAAVARRTRLPWYRQSWELWPAPLRYAALAVMLGSFGGLCFASWQLTRAAGMQLALQEVAQPFSGVIAVVNAFLSVLNGLVVAVKRIHPAILLGCTAAFGFAWALFLGLGTACVKLALAGRQPRY